MPKAIKGFAAVLAAVAIAVVAYALYDHYGAKPKPELTRAERCTEEKKINDEGGAPLSQDCLFWVLGDKELERKFKKEKKE